MSILWEVIRERERWRNSHDRAMSHQHSVVVAGVEFAFVFAVVGFLLMHPAVINHVCSFLRSIFGQ